jgi:hypothetical protein
MERLTDRKTAADLKRNAEGLQAKGIEPNMSDLRYIKLAEYENREEHETGDRIIPLTKLYEFDKIPEDDSRWLKFSPCIDEIHNDPKCVKEAFEFFGFDDFINKRFTEKG